MSKLTAVQKASLKSSDFAFPKEKAYPIHDVGHQKAALMYGKQFLSVEKYALLKQKIVLKKAAATKAALGA